MVSPVTRSDRPWKTRPTGPHEGLTDNRADVLRLIEGNPPEFPEGIMIVLGIVLLVVGYLLGIQILWTLGIILVVVGVILVLLGSVGRPIMGRRHYW